MSQLLSWQPAGLTAAGNALGARAREAGAAGELLAGVRAGLPSVWEGAAADAAAGHLAGRVAEVEKTTSLLDRVSRVLLDAADGLARARDELQAGLTAAAAAGCTVADDGTLTPPRVPGALTLLAGDALVDAERERAQAVADGAALAARLAGPIAAALQAADAADTAAQGRLLALRPPVIGPPARTEPDLAGAVLSASPVPAIGTDPLWTAAWWAGLTAAAQQQLLRDDPALLGRLDGLPAAVRDRANRAALADARAGVLADIDRLERRVAESWFGGTFTDDDAALGHARGKLEALDAVVSTLARPDRHLLLLDLSGEQAKAVVANGDVDTAEHVAVFTPGMTTTVQGSLSGYDRQLEMVRALSQDVLDKAGGGRVATVAWLGYEAPQWGDTWRPSHTVLGSSAAERGAEQLSAFYAGLDAARPEPAHLTALGHSYGSLTTGLALQAGTGVDDAVLFGSPGLGTDEVSDLHLPAGHAYLLEADGDVVVADAGWFGTDPSELTGLSGLSTEESVVDGRRRSASHGHSEYLTADTTSQYALAAVVAGRPELAPRAPLTPPRTPPDVLWPGP